MSKRSLRYRGYGITLEVPGKFVRAIRRVIPRRDEKVGDEKVGDDKLVIGDVPAVSLESRERAMTMVHEMVSDSAQAAGKVRPGSDDEAIAQHPWYHTIEFPDGSVTDGRWDHRPLVPHYGLPADLTGKRVLDVGSGDGFWAFELERRGGKVTSVDLVSYRDVDFPPAIQAVFAEHPVDVSFRHGIDLARRRLESSVELVNSTIYDVSPDNLGTFDFVHTADILLHLRDPALALTRLRSVTGGEFLIADNFDPTLDELGTGPGLTRYLGGWNDVTWWRPALSTLVQMVADAGFQNVEVLTVYQLADRDSESGPWRAVIRGTA